MSNAELEARRSFAVPLLVPHDLDGVREKLQDEFGFAEDDDQAENPKLDEFLDTMKDLNFYDYLALMKVDPNQDIESWRSYAKMFMLPLMQCIAPVILILHRLPNGTIAFEKDLGDQGICPNDDSITFRGLGLVLIVYSVWQIVDGALEGPTILLSQTSARHFATTSIFPRIYFTFGFWVQWFCGLTLMVALYVLLCSSDDPLDIVMNCVALNFLLDVDNEWVTGTNQAKGEKAAEYLFKDLRDTVDKYEDDVRQGLKSRSTFFRTHAEKLMVGSMVAATYFTSIMGHGIAVFFFVCKAKW